MKLAVVLSGFYEEAARRAARLGFSALVPFFDATLSEDAMPRLRRALAEMDVTPIMLNAYVNLVHPDEKVRRQNIAHLQQALQAASAFGCPWVNTMAGTRDPELTWWAYHPDNFSSETWDCLTDSVHEVLDGLPAAGAGLDRSLPQTSWLRSSRRSTRPSCASSSIR
jgi:sugar phosphate isomerase/epimerase